MDLVHVDEPRVGGEVREHAAYVLGDRFRVVVADEGKVELVEGNGTDPAVPVREGQVDGAVREAVGVHPAT